MSTLKIQTPPATTSPLASTSSVPTSSESAWNTPIFSDFDLPTDIALPKVDESAILEEAIDKQLRIVEVAMQQITTENVAVPSVAALEVHEEKMDNKELFEHVELFDNMVDEPRSNHFQRGETSEIWGIKLDRVRMEDTIEAIESMVADRKPRYVITANLNFAMLLAGDESLQIVTDDASLVLADGQPIVWRSKVGAAGALPERVAGSELIYRLAERAALRGWRLYFLGAEPGVANRCADTLVKRYPGLKIAGVQSPPYRKLSENEARIQRQQIIDSRADILFVAFGQPKGERWIHENYQQLGVPVSIQIGASFDFVAGTAKRAPRVWQRLGLEWAYRMLSSPGRLVPRYAGNASYLFLALIRDWRDYVNAKYGPEAYSN